MGASLEKSIHHYLQDHHIVSLATHGSDGPWSSAVFYVADEWDLIFLSAPRSRHALNIAANGSTAGTIQDNTEDWQQIKGLQLEGRSAAVAAGQRERAIAIYQQRFPITGANAPTAIAAALPRVEFYRFETERIYYIDNAQGFGHRECLEPNRAA